MHKQILGYVPANLVPAVVSFAMIFAYTRILTPASFGSYTFVFSAVLVAQISFFYAISIGILRFYPGAAMAGRRDKFLKESYSIFYAVGLVLVGACLAASQVFDRSSELSVFAWLALPLLVFRAAVSMNQAVNRSTDSIWRYNAIECAHAALGFALGLAFIFLIGRTAEAVILGLLVAAVLCSLVDLRLLIAPFRRRIGRIDRTSLLRLIGFSSPLVAVAISASLLQLSDRFLLGTLGDAQMLGIYAVAYSLVDRPTALICASISTATFPMAVQILERQGREAGRIQLGKNGAALLALTLPACAGLALTSPYIAAVLVGPDFRAGVAELIPIMCFTALFRGVRGHFVDHAFTLAGRSSLMLWSYGPAAAANVAINLLVVPRYGMFGAAWTGLGCQAGAVVLGWIIGRRVFPIWLPGAQVFKTVAAVVPMAVALIVVRFSLTWLGLLEAIGLGAGVFAVAALLLDVGGARYLARRPLRMVFAR